MRAASRWTLDDDAAISGRGSPAPPLFVKPDRGRFQGGPWRDARDWTARKYAMWARGEKLPSQKPSSLMTCPCGVRFDSHRLEHNLVHVPHISAAQA
jgi:hypothetical protein